jgi:hypothetical protein
VDGLGGHIREDDAGGVNATGSRLRLDMRLAVRREAQEPQDAAGKYVKACHVVWMKTVQRLQMKLLDEDRGAPSSASLAALRVADGL